jgi:uncharacterized membrane protein YfcA
MISIFVLIGIFTGIVAGMFGIGGGILVVPALTYILGFSQERATGTSLAVLLPPVGILACIQYYRTGNVDLKAALWIALGLVLGAWLGSLGAHKIGEVWLKLSFGIFVVLTGLWIVWDAWKGLNAKGL